MKVTTAAAITAAMAALALAMAGRVDPAHPHEVPDLKRDSGWPLLIKDGKTVVYPGRPVRTRNLVPRKIHDNGK